MTRRILLVLLAFTAVVIAGAMVPLALNASENDRTSFIQETVDEVNTDAAVVQARLDTPNAAYPPLITVRRQVRAAGDGLLILRAGNAVSASLTNQGMPPGNWARLAEDADTRIRNAGPAHLPVTENIGSWVLAATPVYSPTGPLVGTVILARPTAALNRAILALWIILGTVAAVAMLAATLLAFALARWVSRPLAGLDSAAGRLADGHLASRAVVGSGPPELRRLATTFNTMAGRLEALVHGNRAVIADVSHQLRTPLAALRLRLDLLAADTAQSDPATGHELAGALEELARLSRLVDGLLAVARAENVVPVPVAIDVADAARERVAAWHPVADDRNIGLEARTQEPREGGRVGGGGTRGPALAWIGEGHLEQVLDNLIANALEALSAGRQIVVTTKATTAGPRITVSDDGPGMNAEERERAFLRFSTSNPNGTGLGLAIVHRLVTSNGGTASLAETPGGGLTVTLDFPGVPALNGNGSGNAAADSTSPGPGAAAPDLVLLPTRETPRL
ncbi:MAG: HAMP domain-containing histidine kinase [Actinomycetota bacterium]|nr:HAMP domain-containing histidine kinase [Actinomycetota bacterium]